MRRMLVFVLLMFLVMFALGSRTACAYGAVAETVNITVIYDNYRTDDRLDVDWGFAALIETGNQTVLFDTGTNGKILLDNMALLELGPASIDSIVLSHAHADHVGGLEALIGAGAEPDTVYLLPTFPLAIKNTVLNVAQVVEVEPGQVIAPGIVSTGELTTGPFPEQALLIDTADGLIVMTGCAHPGIVEIVQTAINMSGRPITLVVGGFHLLDKATSQIEAIISEFRDLDVAQVGASHCTGNLAIRLFEREYGDDFVPVGVGSVFAYAADHASGEPEASTD